MSFRGYIILRPGAQGGFFENQYPLEACLRSFGKSQSGRYPQCHTFHSCLFSVTHAIKLSGSISRHGFTRSPRFHFCLHCFTVCFPFFLREQKKGKRENCWRSPRPSKMNCVQLCDVASNRVQPFSVQKVQMALQPARQIFSRPRFLLYQRGAVSQISLAGPPVLLKTMPSHLSLVRLPTPLQKHSRTGELRFGSFNKTRRDGQCTWPIAYRDRDKFVAWNKWPPPSGKGLWWNESTW